MKALRTFVWSTLVGGLFVVVPVYLSVLLLLKAMKSVAGLVQPIAVLLPEEIPAQNLLSLLLILFVCFLVGAAVRTGGGQAARKRIEAVCTERLPGYALLRSLTRRLAGDGEEKSWKPALAEIEDALVPAFVIEEIADGRLTIFVPSIPTPFAGAVYILERQRVHLVDVPFGQAIRSVSRWGAGSGDLVAAMQTAMPPAIQPAAMGAGVVSDR